MSIHGMQWTVPWTTCLALARVHKGGAVADHIGYDKETDTWPGLELEEENRLLWAILIGHFLLLIKRRLWYDSTWIYPQIQDW